MIEYIMSHFGGSLPAVLMGVMILNILLSAAGQVFVALGKISPPWLQTAMSIGKKVVDFLSANLPHSQPAPKEPTKPEFGV